MISSQVRLWYQTLGLDIDKDENDYGKIKEAFTRLIRKYTENRSRRIEINVAYAEIGFHINKQKWLNKAQDIFWHIINGNIGQVQLMIKFDKNSIYKRFPPGYPTIYIAVRSGHYDIVDLLLKNGYWDYEKDRSTPLHCAAYYGHYGIITLLVNSGIPLQIKNFSDHYAVDEACTTPIETLLSEGLKDPIFQLFEKLRESKFCPHHIEIRDKNQIVCRKAIHKNYINLIKNKQGDIKHEVRAFHGTRKEVMLSIAEHGLKKPGELVNGKKIKIQQGHIPADLTVRGVKNWACSIFTSPSIFYAANPVYSRQVITNSKQSWLPIVQVILKKGFYGQYESTTPSHSALAGQPVKVQYVVKDADNIQFGMFNRTEDSSSVTVISIMFVSKKYLDSSPSYQNTTRLMHDSPQEIELRKKILNHLA